MDVPTPLLSIEKVLLRALQLWSSPSLKLKSMRSVAGEESRLSAREYKGSDSVAKVSE